MANRKNKAPGKKPKRGFAVLDREKALKSAADAIRIFRALSKFGTSTAAWRCGLGYALELLELELNDILLFSSAKRLPDDLCGDAEAVPVPADLGKARKGAAGAVKVLRNILKDRSEERRVGKECR